MLPYLYDDWGLERGGSISHCSFVCLSVAVDQKWYHTFCLSEELFCVLCRELEFTVFPFHMGHGTNPIFLPETYVRR